MSATSDQKIKEISEKFKSTIAFLSAVYGTKESAKIKNTIDLLKYFFKLYPQKFENITKEEAEVIASYFPQTKKEQEENPKFKGKRILTADQIIEARSQGTKEINQEYQKSLFQIFSNTGSSACRYISPDQTIVFERFIIDDSVENALDYLNPEVEGENIFSKFWNKTIEYLKPKTVFEKFYGFSEDLSELTAEEFFKQKFLTGYCTIDHAILYKYREKNVKTAQIPQRYLEPTKFEERFGEVAQDTFSSDVFIISPNFADIFKKLNLEESGIKQLFMTEKELAQQTPEETVKIAPEDIPELKENLFFISGYTHFPLYGLLEKIPSRLSNSKYPSVSFNILFALDNKTMKKDLDFGTLQNHPYFKGSVFKIRSKFNGLHPSTTPSPGTTLYFSDYENRYEDFDTRASMATFPAAVMRGYNPLPFTLKQKSFVGGDDKYRFTLKFQVAQDVKFEDHVVQTGQNQLNFIPSLVEQGYIDKVDDGIAYLKKVEEESYFNMFTKTISSYWDELTKSKRQQRREKSGEYKTVIKEENVKNKLKDVIGVLIQGKEIFDDIDLSEINPAFRDFHLKKEHFAKFFRDQSFRESKRTDPNYDFLNQFVNITDDQGNVIRGPERRLDGIALSLYVRFLYDLDNIYLMFHQNAGVYGKMNNNTFENINDKSEFQVVDQLVFSEFVDEFAKGLEYDKEDFLKREILKVGYVSLFNLAALYNENAVIRIDNNNTSLHFDAMLEAYSRIYKKTQMALRNIFVVYYDDNYQSFDQLYKTQQEFIDKNLKDPIQKYDIDPSLMVLYKKFSIEDGTNENVLFVQPQTAQTIQEFYDIIPIKLSLKEKEYVKIMISPIEISTIAGGLLQNRLVINQKYLNNAVETEEQLKQRKQQGGALLENSNDPEKWNTFKTTLFEVAMKHRNEIIQNFPMQLIKNAKTYSQNSKVDTISFEKAKLESDFNLTEFLKTYKEKQKPNISLISKFYDFQQTIASIQESQDNWFVDFAAKKLGGGWNRNGWAQEENLVAQFIEFAILLKNVTKNAENELTMNDDEAILIKNLLQNSITNPKQYGTNILKNSVSDLGDEDFVQQNILEKVPRDPKKIQTYVNFVAVNAEKLDSPIEIGEYTKAQIDKMLLKAYIGFRAAKDNKAKTIHTGEWGTGVYNHLGSVSFLVQYLAAWMAGFGEEKDIIHFAFYFQEKNETSSAKYNLYQSGIKNWINKIDYPFELYNKILLRYTKDVEDDDLIDTETVEIVPEKELEEELKKEQTTIFDIVAEEEEEEEKAETPKQEEKTSSFFKVPKILQTIGSFFKQKIAPTSTEPEQPKPTETPKEEPEKQEEEKPKPEPIPKVAPKKEESEPVTASTIPEQKKELLISPKPKPTPKKVPKKQPDSPPVVKRTEVKTIPRAQIILQQKEQEAQSLYNTLKKTLEKKAERFETEEIPPLVITQQELEGQIEPEEEEEEREKFSIANTEELRQLISNVKSASLDKQTLSNNRSNKVGFLKREKKATVGQTFFD